MGTGPARGLIVQREGGALARVVLAPASNDVSERFVLAPASNDISERFVLSPTWNGADRALAWLGHAPPDDAERVAS